MEEGIGGGVVREVVRGVGEGEGGVAKLVRRHVPSTTITKQPLLGSKSCLSVGNDMMREASAISSSRGCATIARTGKLP